MDVREALRRKMRESALDPIEQLSMLLIGELGDGESLDDLRRSLTARAKTHRRAVLRDLDKIDFALSEALPPGELLRLVTGYANRRIEPPTDEAARAWLEEVADVVRSVLSHTLESEGQPPG